MPETATAPRCWEIKHGVTVVATGGYEYKGHVYLYGQDPRVITQLELEKRLAEDVDAARQLKQVVMIQCVKGPEQKIPYCSRTCCTNTMKNAIAIKRINPDCQVYVLYKDLITYGFREEYYTEARERGVIFLRYDEEDAPQVQISYGETRSAGERRDPGQAAHLHPRPVGAVDGNHARREQLRRWPSCWMCPCRARAFSWRPI